MMNKLKFLIRLFPLIIIVVILVILNSINSKSEVYLDITTNQILFTNDSSIKLDIIDIESIKILQANIKNFEFENLKLSRNNKIFRDVDIDTKIEDLSREASFEINKGNGLKLKELVIPDQSDILIARSEDKIIIEIYTKNNEKLNGKIHVIDSLFLIPENIKLSETEIDYKNLDTLMGHVDIFNENISFVSQDNFIGLVLQLKKKNQKEKKILIPNLTNSQFKEVKFLKYDKTRKNHREESTILKGSGQIGSIDLFKKRFLIKDIKINKGDFIVFKNEDLFFLDDIYLPEEGLGISMYGEKINEIRLGKRLNWVRSIFPTKLDYLIKEPSKIAIWSVISFLIAQILLYKKLFPKKEEK